MRDWLLYNLAIFICEGMLAVVAGFWGVTAVFMLPTPHPPIRRLFLPGVSEGYCPVEYHNTFVGIM